MTQEVDLVGLFQSVTQALVQNQQALNQADEINQDHGTNMVQTFQSITRSLEARQGKPVSTALSYAAKQVSKTTTSGSGQLYAQGLAQAATQFKGKQMDSRGAMQLLQTLIGGGQASQPSRGDLLGSLLGGLLGGGAAQPSGAESPGLDLGDLLNAGMSFMQSQQSGANTLESLVQAFSAAGGMGNTVHRNQSTSLVVNTFLQALGGLSKK